MGFSLKKIAKSVATVATAPVVATVKLEQSASNKLGISDTVKSVTGIDINNVQNVVTNSLQLKGSTGSTDFKNAFFDSAKLGAAAATAGGSITALQGGAAVVGLSKIQSGGKISANDVLGATGMSLPGLDLGGLDIFKNLKMPSAGVNTSIPDIGSLFSSNQPIGISGTNSNNNMSIIVIIGIILFLIFTVALATRK